MFNFFRKTESKDKCYLITSNAFEKKVLDEDSLSLYNGILNDEKASGYFKDLIIKFLLPFKISLLKFSLNKEFYEDPFPVNIHNNIQVAPSLKIIKENPFDYISLGYPSWFYMAFPDVALWAMNGEGQILIKNKFKKYSEDELTDGNHIRANLLKYIIKLYLSKTGKSLECKKY